MMSKKLLTDENKKLVIISEELPRTTYDSGFENDSYLFLFNKIVSAIKSIYRKDGTNVVLTTGCNIPGLISSCAAINAKFEAIGNREMKVGVVLPAQPSKMPELLINEKERQMWEYIRLNADKFYTVDCDELREGKIVDSLKIFKKMETFSDIVLGIFNLTDKSSYLSPNSGIVGRTTPASIAISQAVKNGKDIRAIDNIEIVYRNLSANNMNPNMPKQKRKSKTKKLENV